MAQVQWLKLYIDIFDNEKIKKLLRNREGDSYFRAWIQLLILAGKSNNKGAVLLGENIPMSLEDLAKVMHKTLPKLTTIIQTLCELDMIFVEDDTIFVKNWSIYQNADELDRIRENGRKRTQKCRANQKKCNVTETLRNTEEKNKEENIIRKEEETQVENESGFKD